MPNPAINSPSPYQSLSDKKPFLKGKKRKLLLLFGCIAFASALAYLTVKNNIQIPGIFNPNKDESKEIVNKDNNEFTDKAIRNIPTTTIEDIKEASNSTGVNPLESPSLSDTETSKKIYEEIGNKDPQNHIIGYGDGGIGAEGIEIKQGDLVTWVNSSSEPMTVVGEGWQSATPRQPGDQFTYTFLFLGDYKYKINDKFEGTVTVTQ